MVKNKSACHILFVSTNTFSYLQAKTKNSVFLSCRCIFPISFCASLVVRACFGNATDSFVFLAMYLPFAYINLILYGVTTEAFKCVGYQC